MMNEILKATAFSLGITKNHLKKTNNNNIKLLPLRRNLKSSNVTLLQ